MTTKDLLNQYQEISQKIAAYSLALNTMNWDASTVAPKDGSDYRNRMGAILAGELFSITTSVTYIDLIQSLSQVSDLDDVTKREVAQILKDLEKNRYIPKDLFVAYSQLVRDGESIWEKAKDAKDYGMFKDILGRLIETTKQVISYRKCDLPIYQQLLDDFEPGLSVKQYDQFFDKLKTDLVPLIHRINALDTPRPAWLSAEIPVEIQRKVVKRISKYLGYSEKTGLISESAHPFSSGFSALDNRVTVRYHSDAFTSSIFALIHEIGHATYNGQVDPAYDGRHVRNSMSYGMHESQSRLYENMLGRSEAFWSTLYPEIQELAPQLKDVALPAFIAGINYVAKSLIRIEADELTYPLHIMVRYEIEKGLFDGTLNTEGLDTVWADKYEDYLGIRPENAAEGVLQDIHWSGGAFGYFPTYALGSAYSAQWMKRMRKDLDVETLLAQDRFCEINAWLKQNIHTHGGVYTAEELLKSVTGETFNPQYYVDYLVEKYSKLYHLD